MLIGKNNPTLALVCAALCFSGLVRAQQEKRDVEETEFVEPIITEETMPTPAGHWSLRFTMERHSAEAGEIRAAYPRLQLFFGLTDRLGVELNAPFAYTYRSGEGRACRLGDVSSSFKWLLVRHSRRVPAIVAGVELGLPTGRVANETGEGILEIRPYVALLKDYGFLSIQGNIGKASTLLTRGGAPNHDFGYDWALAVPVRGNALQILGEINGVRGADGRDNQLAFSPGLHLRVSESMSLGVGVPLGLRKNTPAWGIVARVQFALRSNGRGEGLGRRQRGGS